MAKCEVPLDAGAEPIGHDREERERALRPVAEQLANLRRREGEDLGHEGRVDSKEPCSMRDHSSKNEPRLPKLVSSPGNAEK